MAKEDVVKDIEQVIKAAKIDMKKNGVTSDKVRQFTGLVNSFTRLTTRKYSGSLWGLRVALNGGRLAKRKGYGL